MKSQKVLFIGLDSVEPELLKQWCKSGELKTLNRIWEQSVWSDVSIPKGFSNGAMWPSLFTGVDPSVHSRYNYRCIELGTYNINRYFQEDVDYQAIPFWVEFSNRGKRVGIVDVPRAPLTPNINGVQIVDWLTHDRRSAITRSYPAGLAQETIDTFCADEMGERPEAYLESHSQQEFIELLKKRIDIRAEQTIQLASQTDYDFYMTVFGEPHDIGHMSWHLHDATHLQYDNSLGDPVKDIYIALDRAVEKIMTSLNYSQVVIFSGPGMTDNYGANEGFDQILQKTEERYIQHSQGQKSLFSIETNQSDHKRSAPVQRRSFAAQLKSIIRRYLPKELRGKIYGKLPAAVRKREQKLMAGQQLLFGLPFGNTGFAIRLNVVGREPSGRINPGQEYDQICDFLRQSLADVKNLDTGEPLISEFIQLDQCYSGQALNVLPDIIVNWNRKAPISRVGSEELGEFSVSCYTRRTGEHNENALVWLKSDRLQPQQLDGVMPVEHIAPMIARLLDVKWENKASPNSKTTLLKMIDETLYR